MTARGEFGSLGERYVSWDLGLLRGFVFCLKGGVLMEKPLLLRVREVGDALGGH